MHIMLYERITFLLVAGTLGLFVIAFLLGAAGVVLTYQPELPKRIIEILDRTERILRKSIAYATGEVKIIRSGVSARFRSLRI